MKAMSSMAAMKQRLLTLSARRRTQEEHVRSLL